MSVVCEFGQGVTDAFFSIHQTFEEFYWYRHPLAMRKMLLIILPIVQKPVDLRCFGSVAANRENFKKVCMTNKNRLPDQFEPDMQFPDSPFSGGKHWIFIFHSTSKFFKLKKDR